MSYTIKNNDSELFLGPTYYILNPIFKKFENYYRTFTSKARNILITMGGGDQKNLTIKVSESIVNMKNIHLNIILGKLFQNFSEIEMLKTKNPSKITIYQDINNMEELMKENDIIISTGGNTSFEAAYMGIPGILINQNDLQSQNSILYNEKGVFIDLGVGQKLPNKDIRKKVEEFTNSKELRKKMNSNSKKMQISKDISIVIESIIS